MKKNKLIIILVLFIIVIASAVAIFNKQSSKTDVYQSSGKSTEEKLFSLPDDTLVFPGHEESTTIRNEKNYNPVNFFK